ncbi:hypothetical protein SCE1572_12150 [Sorangium cellulosum So0157-2]|uniref:Uncharacterized protein n=1 Tax=Sorangium cellulosum So0157-2 TaxID=1254432 RepID=S4XPT0_SORCE|nr:hypothetical protein SCE1572_12150 [Sorangium cellulosum So0157-2]
MVFVFSLVRMSVLFAVCSKRTPLFATVPFTQLCTSAVMLTVW